jgi:hypothetical protein
MDNSKIPDSQQRQEILSLTHLKTAQQFNVTRNNNKIRVPFCWIVVWMMAQELLSDYLLKMEWILLTQQAQLSRNLDLLAIKIQRVKIQ